MAATRNERSERRARPIGRAGSFSDRSLSISISNSIALLNWNIPTGISICSLTLYLLHMFLYSIRNIFYSIRNIFYSIRNNYSRGNIPYGIIIPGGIFFYSIRNNYSRGNIFYSKRNIIPGGIFRLEYFFIPNGILFHTEYFFIPNGILFQGEYSIRNIFLFQTEYYSKGNIPYGIFFYSMRNIIPRGIFSFGKKGGRKMSSPLEIFSPLSDPIRPHALEYRAEPKR